VSLQVFIFAAFALAAVGGAVATVAMRNAVYAAMGLLTTMFSLAVFYVMLEAHFIAVVHVIVYAGAVMTLFLFVIMLIGVDRAEDRTESIPFQRPLVAVLGGGLLVLLVVAARAAWVTGTAVEGGVADGTIENISNELFGTWMLPFQSTILLLTIAAVGTVALAKFALSRRAGAVTEPALDGEDGGGA